MTKITEKDSRWVGAGQVGGAGQAMVDGSKTLNSETLGDLKTHCKLEPKLPVLCEK